MNEIERLTAENAELRRALDEQIAYTHALVARIVELGGSKAVPEDPVSPLRLGFDETYAIEEEADAPDDGEAAIAREREAIYAEERAAEHRHARLEEYRRQRAEADRSFFRSKLQQANWQGRRGR